MEEPRSILADLRRNIEDVGGVMGYGECRDLRIVRFGYGYPAQDVPMSSVCATGSPVRARTSSHHSRLQDPGRAVCPCWETLVLDCVINIRKRTITIGVIEQRGSRQLLREERDICQKDQQEQ